jgi:hypothetical protein
MRSDGSISAVDRLAHSAVDRLARSVVDRLARGLVRLMIAITHVEADKSAG